MTMTRSPAGADALGQETADPPNPSGDIDPTATAARRTKSSVVPHRNEILVVGELTPPVEPRQRADGQEVLTFRVAVRGAASVTGRDSPPTGSRDATPAGRRDILDCVVSSTAMRRRLETYRPGDVVELAGSLRHRFWNTGGRIQSRYEIEVGTLKRLARDRASRSPRS